LIAKASLFWRAMRQLSPNRERKRTGSGVFFGSFKSGCERFGVFRDFFGECCPKKGVSARGQANGAERGGKKGTQGAEKEAGEEVENDEKQTERAQAREFE